MAESTLTLNYGDLCRAVCNRCCCCSLFNLPCILNQENRKSLNCTVLLINLLSSLWMNTSKLCLEHTFKLDTILLEKGAEDSRFNLH